MALRVALTNWNPLGHPRPGPGWVGGPVSPEGAASGLSGAGAPRSQGGRCCQSRPLDPSSQSCRPVAGEVERGLEGLLEEAARSLLGVHSTLWGAVVPTGASPRWCFLLPGAATLRPNPLLGLGRQEARAHC